MNIITWTIIRGNWYSNDVTVLYLKTGRVWVPVFCKSAGFWVGRVQPMAKQPHLPISGCKWSQHTKTKLPFLLSVLLHNGICIILSELKVLSSGGFGTVTGTHTRSVCWIQQCIQLFDLALLICYSLVWAFLQILKFLLKTWNLNTCTSLILLLEPKNLQCESWWLLVVQHGPSNLLPPSGLPHTSSLSLGISMVGGKTAHML